MFIDPKVLCLNVELELKAEKDNAEVRVSEVSVRISFFSADCRAWSKTEETKADHVYDDSIHILFSLPSSLNI